MIKLFTFFLIMISITNCSNISIPLFISVEESFFEFGKKLFSSLINFYPKVKEVDSPILPVEESTKPHAMGFQYNSGPVWAILCKTPYGIIPGKLDGAGGAYYPWGWIEHKCESYEKVYGILYPNKGTIPTSCKPKGYQTNDKSKYFNAVIQSNKGLVPGKASQDLKYAWYSWGGKETPVTDDFYVIC